MEQQIQNQTNNKTKNNTPLLLIVVILITAIIIGGIVYFWQQSVNKKMASDLEKRMLELQEQISPTANQNNPVSNNSNNEPASQNTETVDAYAGWKTYNNSRYSYTIKYPSNWFVDTTYSENDFTQRGPVEDNEFIGGDTIFANYANYLDFNMDNPAPKDSFPIFLMVYKTDMDYNQFIASWRNPYNPKKENVTINGVGAIKLSYAESSDSPAGVSFLIKSGNRMFKFDYSDYHENLNQMNDIAEKIIYSFQLK